MRRHCPAERRGAMRCPLCQRRLPACARMTLRSMRACVACWYKSRAWRRLACSRCAWILSGRCEDGRYACVPCMAVHAPSSSTRGKCGWCLVGASRDAHAHKLHSLEQRPPCLACMRPSSSLIHLERVDAALAPHVARKTRIHPSDMLRVPVRRRSRIAADYQAIASAAPFLTQLSLTPPASATDCWLRYCCAASWSDLVTACI
jgi:hypothetical protein